jgi:uncharacterized protein
MDLVIGFLIAVVIALTGVGAGVITAPMLILFLHLPVEVAVSTALAFSAIVKLIVVPAQIIRRQVNYRVLGFMLIGGLPGVVLGSVLFKYVAAQGPRSVLYFVLGAIILFSACWHLFSHFRPGGIARPLRDRSRMIGAVMFPIGAEVGFSSSGAGALGTVALLGMTDLTAAQVVGTDLAFGLAIAMVGRSLRRSSFAEDGPWRNRRRRRRHSCRTENSQPRAPVCPFALAGRHWATVLLSGCKVVEKRSAIRRAHHLPSLPDDQVMAPRFPGHQGSINSP